MKFEVNSTYLAEMLKPIVSGIYHSESIWLNATDDSLEAIVIATCGVVASVAIKCTEHPELQYVCRVPGGGAVNAGVLQEHLKSIKNRTILIEFSETPRIVILPDCGEEQLLFMQPFGTFDRSFILQKPDCRFTVEREILLDTLKAVRYAMGTDANKPYYQGIAVEISKGKIRCFAGHGAFFAIRSIYSKSIAKTETVISIFLPSSSIAAIITSLAASTADHIVLKVLSNYGKYVIESSDLQLLIKSTDVKNCNIDSILNYNYPNQLHVNVDEFKYAIAGIAASCTQISGAIISVDMIVDLREGQLILMRNSESMRKVSMTPNSTFCCDSDSTIPLKCNISYLNSVCKHFGDARILRISCEDKSKPIVVEPVNRTGKAASKGCHDLIFFASSQLK